jgi:hypothetical protein
LLFESFFYQRAAKRAWDSFTQEKEGKERTGRLSRDFEDGLFKQMQLKWYGWVLSSIHDRGVGGKQQLFYISRLVKFLGLSRSGQTLLANLGFNCTLRFSDQQNEDMLDVSREELRYNLKSLNCCARIIEKPFTDFPPPPNLL